jgi:MFS superfamily sulfate permease-like transporter
MNEPPAAAAVPIPRPRATWRGELAGGLNASAAMLPFVLTYGVLVFGTAGPAAAALGLTASVLAVVGGGLLVLAFSRSHMPTVAPSASTALILGTLVALLVGDPALSPATPQGAARLVACTGAVVALAGVLLVLLGAAGAGGLVRYVPQPVLAGFMNGVALLILASQLPALLGLSPADWARDGWAAVAQAQPLALLLAALTATLAVLLKRRWPAAPAPMLALVLASLGWWALQAALSIGGPSASALGWPDLARVGAPLPEWPRPDVLAPWLGPEALSILRRHGGAMLGTAALLALIGGLETVLGLAAVDPLLDEPSRPDRELVAVGLSNIVLGLFGGLFVVYLRLRALATLGGGGRSAWSVAVGSLILAAVFTLGLPLVREVPVAVVGGIVVVLALTLVDRWTGQLLQQWRRGERSPDVTQSLAVVMGVCAITLVWGFAAGVAAGVLVSMLLFMRAMNRSMLRLRYRADEIPSRRIHPQAVEQRLQPLRADIEVFEIEGALFFGNAHRLVQLGEAALVSGRPPRHLVVDLRRVSTIDASGAVTLARLAERLARQGVVLHLAGVGADNRHGQALRAQGAQGRWQTHPDADRAIESAESALLDAAGPPTGTARGTVVALAECDLFAGIDAGALQPLLARLGERRLAAGETLFAEGDPGDALYLLTEGSIDIVDRMRTQRYVSLSPGMCFGETAVLDGQGRTAAAVAASASVVHRLAAADLAELARSQPALAAQLHLNLARHVSQRLRAAATAWRRAAG